MFCKFCGKEIPEGKEVCEECMTNQNKNNSEVVENNPIVNDKSSEVIVEDVKENTQKENIDPSSTVSQKSKIAAGLFGIFLGSFGVHNFYLGFTGKAVAQLLITVLSCGILSPISAIWGLIEGILILSGEKSADAYGNKLKE